MKNKISIFLILAVGAIALMIGILHRPTHRDRVETSPAEASAAPEAGHVSDTPRITRPASQTTSEPLERSAPSDSAAPVVTTTNKLERLKQVRETFLALAKGDAATAMRAAKELKNDNERETALLTLVTEWTQGELRPARARAQAIAAYGLEAGLALELLGKPDLAVLWANELTEGPTRTAVLRQAANTMVASDPGAAFALAQYLPEADRFTFVDGLFANWASADTEAALKYADLLPDPNERSEAIAAIRTAAPVGIGAALKIEEGYPVINELIPNMPAALSGQLRPGDRIIALAQGDSAFVNAHSLPLEKVVEMVRGLPNTILQLQVLSADAPPNSLPRMVMIPREQIMFKR